MYVRGSRSFEFKHSLLDRLCTVKVPKHTKIGIINRTPHQISVEILILVDQLLETGKRESSGAYLLK